MNEIIDSLFKLDYMPHGHCYWWKPEILWLNVISDLFIAFAYFSIPVAIYYFVKRRPDIEFKGVFILFSLFILCCGITHLISIVVIWHGSYGIHGLAKLVTAIISCITAYQVYKVIPLALKIPSLNSLHLAYEQATKEKLARIQLENQKTQDSLLRDSTNNAQVGILVIDETGQIILANNAVCQIFEYRQAELEGQNVDILIAASEREDHHGLMEHFLRHPETNKKMAMGRTVYGYSKFNKKVPIEIVLNHRTQNGKAVVYATILDVSARVAAEHALAKSETLTQNIIQALPIGFHMFELVKGELILTAYNPAADLILGINNNELLGQTITEAFPDLIGSEVPEQLAKVAITGIPRVNDINYYDDGLKSGVYLVHSFQSSVNTVVVLFQDITEQKNAEHEIAAKEQFIRRAFDSSITGVYIYNRQTGINEFINASYTRITGLTLSDINNMDDEKFMANFHPDDVEAVQQHMTELFQSKDENKIFVIEYRFKHADGHWIWCLSQDVILERNEQGEGVSFMGSFLDITELKDMQQNLIELKNSAEKANQIKSDFLANMSHEIRTPMNAILGLTHIVLEMDLGNKQREYLSKVETSSKSLLNILNDILDYSKMEAGKINIVNEAFVIDDIFESVTGLFILLAEEKRVELIVELPVGHQRLFMGDQLRITQILNNIVGNALKFTKQGYVKLSLTITDVANDPQQKQLAFSVSDTGIGMSAEQVEQLFSSFTQADTSISRTFGGTGLGLSISKGLAISMGGEIKVTSQPGKGSTFTLELPLAIAPENEDKQLLAPDPMSVLIVDDNETSLITLEKLFLQWNFDVTTCNDSELALAIFKEKSLKGEAFELLVVDWKMPKIDGIELISLIQSQTPMSKDESLKILMVTAYGRKFAEKSLAKQKIQGIIDKPVLTSKIQNILLELQHYGEIGVLPAQPNNMLTESINLQNIHILLVEDNEMNQLVAKDILESFGANVVIASNGEEAVELFNKQYFDLILMDLQMPVMDGFAATNAIRATNAGKNIPILAMSAAVMKSDVEKVASSGMNDHIAKPIDINNMSKVLTKWIKSNGKLTSVHGRTKPNKIIYSDELRLLLEHGFNVENALIKIGHRQTLYITLLKSYYREQQPNVELLKTAIAENNVAFINRLAHSLKSLSATVGADNLHQLACQAEQNNHDKDLLERFCQAFESSCQVIAKALAIYQSNHNQPSALADQVATSVDESPIAEEVVTGVLNSLHQTLTLRKFIDETEFNAIKKVLLAKWSPEELTELFEALDSLAYEQALLALKKLKDI